MIEIVMQISKNGVICGENGLIPWVFPKVIDRIFKEDVKDKHIILGPRANIHSYAGTNKVTVISRRRKKNLTTIIKEGGIVLGGYSTFHTFYPCAERVIYYVVNNTLRGEIFNPFVKDIPLKMSKDYIEDIDQVSRNEFYIARIVHEKNV